MDDIFIHAKTEKELNKTTNTVMKRLKAAGFTLNSAKCEFNQFRVKFLGHVFTEKGCEPDEDKIIAINQLKKPTNVKEVQRLLGMVNYVGKFIKNQSQLTEPLRKLIHKETAWHWEAEHEKAVADIKEALKSLPVLAYYNVNKPVKLSVDASSTAMGCCLMQDDLSSLRNESANKKSTKPTTNRQGSVGDSIRMPEIPQLHLWKRTQHRHRPQTVGNNLQKTDFKCTNAPTGYSMGCASICSESAICQRHNYSHSRYTKSRLQRN